MKILLTIIVVVVAAGGALFAINKKISKKTSQKNIHIEGEGRVVGGDDHSTTYNK